MRIVCVLVSYIIGLQALGYYQYHMLATGSDRERPRSPARPSGLCPAPGKPCEAYWSGSVDLPNCTQSTQSIMDIIYDIKTFNSRRRHRDLTDLERPPAPGIRTATQISAQDTNSHHRIENVTSNKTSSLESRVSADQRRSQFSCVVSAALYTLSLSLSLTLVSLPPPALAHSATSATLLVDSGGHAARRCIGHTACQLTMGRRPRRSAAAADRRPPSP